MCISAVVPLGCHGTQCTWRIDNIPALRVHNICQPLVETSGTGRFSRCTCAELPSAARDKVSACCHVIIIDVRSPKWEHRLICFAQALGFLVEFLRANRNIVALTGAGVSTESSIPDYRGPRGAYSTGFKPMTHQQVLQCAHYGML